MLSAHGAPTIWRVNVWVLFIFLPLAVAAWLKLGPVAGALMLAWVVLMAFIRSQPGGGA